MAKKVIDRAKQNRLFVKATRGTCRKLWNQIRNLRIAVQAAEEDIPELETRLARLKATLPENKKRLKIYEMSYENRRKNLLKQEENMAKTNKMEKLAREIHRLEREVIEG